MALADLHQRNVVYRDLKMENILMTNSGHIILTDLGMSCLLPPGQRSISYVGTPQYMVVNWILLYCSLPRLSIVEAMTRIRTIGHWVFWLIR